MAVMESVLMSTCKVCEVWACSSAMCIAASSVWVDDEWSVVRAAEVVVVVSPCVPSPLATHTKAAHDLPVCGLEEPSVK